ncbi:MAG: hypothetical protein V4710_02930 [Verrucomicrobiota bacterium]
MRHVSLLIAVVFIGGMTSGLFASSLTVINPGFESNVLTNPSANGPDNFIGAAGQGITPVSVPGWTFATGSNPDTFTAYGGVSDLAIPNHGPEGLLDNNIAWLFIRPTGVFGRIIASQQLVGSALENNTLYTLSLRVAQARREEGIETKSNPVFPTLGDGVSTGDVFARLRVGDLNTSMPGFQPSASIVSTVADDSWVNWRLTWQTGSAEPLAGQPLFVQLYHQGTRPTGGLPSEVFFDDIAVTAVPEPTSTALALVAVMGLALQRPRRFLKLTECIRR